MSEFYSDKQNNLYDNLYINVAKLYDDFPINNKEEATSDKSRVPFSQSFFHKLYASKLIPLRYRNYLWYFLKRINIDQSWFDEFKIYWSDVLGARPLWSPQDLYFLRNIYRLKFMHNQVPDTADSETHLKAWQRPELIYMLLHCVFKESITNYVKVFELSRKFSTKKHQVFLEYGASLAPITTAFFEFSMPSKSHRFYIADIQTLAFHYGCYKFRNHSHVIPIILSPENQFRLKLPQKVDTVFCFAVFEHLNEPLETVKIFYDILGTGGLLIFDYIKGDSDGLDTLQGCDERDSVMDFVSDKFDIIHGRIENDKSMGLTIARKR